MDASKATAARVGKAVEVFMSGVLPLTDTPAAEKLSYAKTPRQPGPLTKSDSDRGPAAAEIFWEQLIGLPEGVVRSEFT